MVTVLHLRQSAGAGGGADMVLRDQLRGLAGRDSLALAIAYLHKPGHDVSALTAPLADAGLSVHCLAGSAWADRGQVKALSRLIRETGTSVLHSHDPKSDVLAWWLRRRHPGLKLVATLHGWTARGWKGRLYEAIDKRILKSFDVTLAVSSATAARAARGGPRNSRLLANAIDADFWSAGEDSWVAPAGRLPVIFVGRMSAEKNPLGALEVAALCPALQVTLVGDGPLLDDVREQVAKR
ncbi:MAG: glycosyltransferase, partial [Rhodospirillales bacterium]